MSERMMKLLGDRREGTLAILLYPGFTALDAFGPYHLFVNLNGEQTRFVAKTKDPVPADTGVRVLPDLTFAECPEALLVLCVPGGTTGTLNAMEDAETLNFVRSRGAKAKWVASVCTGSLVLGAAGLLDGYQATGHFLVREELSRFGARPVDQRVVIDRNRITGAGVTAGIDLGLTLLSRMRGEEYAKLVQLFSEYDPQPPFQSGHPSKANPEHVEALREMLGGFVEQIRALPVPAAASKPKSYKEE